MCNRQNKVIKKAKCILFMPLLFLWEQLPVFILELESKNKILSKSWIGYLLFFSVSVQVIFLLIVVLKKVQLFKTHRLNKNVWTMIFLAIVCIFVINLILSPLFKSVGNANVNSQLNVVKSMPLAFITHAVLIAPITEELLFRGYLMNIFPVNPTLNIVLSAIVFAGVHFSNDWIYFLSKLILGIILGYIYLRTKNIKASVLIHFISNTLSLL